MKSKSARNGVSLVVFCKPSSLSDFFFFLPLQPASPGSGTTWCRPGRRVRRPPGTAAPSPAAFPRTRPGRVGSPRNFPGRGSGLDGAHRRPRPGGERSPPRCPAPPGDAPPRLTDKGGSREPQRGLPREPLPAGTGDPQPLPITPGTDSQSYPAARSSARDRSPQPPAAPAHPGQLRRGGYPRRGNSKNSNRDPRPHPPPLPPGVQLRRTPLRPPPPRLRGRLQNSKPSSLHPIRGSSETAITPPPLPGGATLK